MLLLQVLFALPFAALPLLLIALHLGFPSLGASITATSRRICGALRACLTVPVRLALPLLAGVGSSLATAAHASRCLLLLAGMMLALANFTISQLAGSLLADACRAANMGLLQGMKQVRGGGSRMRLAAHPHQELLQ